MLSTEFASYLNGHLQKFFKGVFPFDQIPKSLKSSYFIICNTAKSNLPGEHWFTIYRPSKDLLEIFDSLGVTDEKLELLKPHVMYRGIKKIKFNTTKVQADETQTCGHHTLYFIYERLYNQDLRFKEILNLIYTNNLNTNETLLKTFFKDFLEKEI